MITSGVTVQPDVGDRDHMLGMRGPFLAVMGCLTCITFYALANPVLAQTSGPPQSVIGLGWLQQAELDPSAHFLGTCSDSALHIWRLNGSLVSVLPARGGVPWGGFSWSPDGSMIAISNFRGCITVARVPDLSIIAEIEPANYTQWLPYPDLSAQIVPRRIRWSPNGSRLAYGWWDGTADIFDVKTQRLVTSLDQTDFGTPSVGGSFSCEGDLDWSPDGARILRTGVKKTLEKLPDGDFLVKTGGNEVLVFNVSSGRGLFRLGRGSEQASGSTCTPNPGVLNAFSPDGSMIACWSGSLDLYDATSGRVITSTKIDGYVKSLAWSSNGELIALGTLKGRILVWRKSDRQLVSNISGHESSVVSLSWEGSVLASASADWTVKLWYVHADGSMSPIRTFKGWSSAPVGTISWYPDGERIAITSGPAKTEIVSTSPVGGTAVTYKSRHSISVLTTDGSEQLRVEPGPEDGWAGLGYVSPDGRMIASITGRGEVSVWDAGFGSLASRLYAGQQAVVDLGWNPVRPGVLAVGGLNGFEIWNVFDVEPKPLWVVRLGGQVRCLAWSPDGTGLAVGYDLGSGMSGSRVEIWDPYTPVMVCSQSAGGWWRVCSLAWSPDGSRLASLATLHWYDLTSNPLPLEYCGLNEIGNVSVWRVGMKPAPSGLTVLGSVLVPRSSDLSTICLQSWLDWAPNSTMLAVATGASEFMGATREDLESCPFLAEPAVRIYTLGSDGSGPLAPCLTLGYHVRPLSYVVWSPDGSRIAAGSYDGSISIWQVGSVSVGELSGWADAWVMLIVAFLVLFLAPNGGLARNSQGMFRQLN